MACPDGHDDARYKTDDACGKVSDVEVKSRENFLTLSND